MAAEMSVSSRTKAFRFHRKSLLPSTHNMLSIQCLPSSPVINPSHRILSLTICYVTEATRTHRITRIKLESTEEAEHMNYISVHEAETLERKQSDPNDIVAPMSCFGILFMVVLAVYLKFSWQMEGGDIPVAEMLITFASFVAAAVGTEVLSAWVHREFWHASLWYIHKSHHRPRKDLFEFNDVFAVVNALPAIALINFGFFHKGILSGLCFGAGLGMTVLGMAYILIHNGLSHQRFPVGLVAGVPYLHRVVAAHQIHHSGKFAGIPYGLFLGPQELEEVRGGTEELERVISCRHAQT